MICNVWSHQWWPHPLLQLQILRTAIPISFRQQCHLQVWKIQQAAQPQPTSHQLILLPFDKWSSTANQNLTSSWHGWQCYPTCLVPKKPQYFLLIKIANSPFSCLVTGNNLPQPPLHPDWPRMLSHPSTDANAVSNIHTTFTAQSTPLLPCQRIGGIAICHHYCLHKVSTTKPFITQ